MSIVNNMVETKSDKIKCTILFLVLIFLTSIGYGQSSRNDKNSYKYYYYKAGLFHYRSQHDKAFQLLDSGINHFKNSDEESMVLLETSKISSIDRFIGNDSALIFANQILDEYSSNKRKHPELEGKFLSMKASILEKKTEYLKSIELEKIAIERYLLIDSTFNLFLTVKKISLLRVIGVLQETI